MREHYFFDNAGTTWPKPEVVYQTMDSFLRSYGVNPGRGAHEMAAEADRMVTETRRLLAEFFGYNGPSERVVFGQNVTDALNMALFGLLSPGDHLITTRMEHNSTVRPANHLERDGGVEVTWIAADVEGYVDPADIAAALRPNTRVVSINHGSNVLGTVQDAEGIGRVVAASDAFFVIDTAQTAGVLDVDMERFQIDVLTFTGHKGLFGPMGVGGLIVREGVPIRHARVGGTGVNSIDPFQPDEYPHRLEAGTVNLPGITGLNAAQKWFADLGRQKAGAKVTGMTHRQLCQVALAHIEQTEVGHVRYLSDQLRRMEGVTVYGPPGNRPRVAVLAFNIDGIPATQVGDMLDADHHVCVRAGLHCAPLVHQDRNTVEQMGAVRISPGYFTDEQDIQQVLAGVADIAGIAVPS